MMHRLIPEQWILQMFGVLSYSNTLPDVKSLLLYSDFSCGLQWCSRGISSDDLGYAWNKLHKIALNYYRATHNEDIYIFILWEKSAVGKFPII